MQPEFWHERWRTAQIGFHQLTVDRLLREYWAALKLAAGSRVFVPLCGKSLDLLWLRDQGHLVIGVEFSRIAVEAFFMENGILARRRALADFEAYEAEGLTLYCGDFFKLTPALLGNIASVYDRASLISWTPELRAPYAARMTELTGSATQTLLITVEYPPLQMNGPPFPVFGADLKSLYAGRAEIEVLGAHEIREPEPRFKARGLTQMREVCYRLTRLG